MEKINIDEELKNLIPPLADAEFAQLEENILRDGIQDPLKVWQGILIDGHNRYSIAQKHNLPFEVSEMDFKNKDAVKEWIILNQFGRRNLSAYDRVCLALTLKPTIAAKAKERMTKGTADPMPILAEGTTTNEVIAKIAGVGKETVRKVEKIQNSGMTEIIHLLRTGAISINAAYSAINADAPTVPEEVINGIAQNLKSFKENRAKLFELIDKAKKQMTKNEFEEFLRNVDISQKTLDALKSLAV